MLYQCMVCMRWHAVSVYLHTVCMSLSLESRSWWLISEALPYHWWYQWCSYRSAIKIPINRSGEQEATPRRWTVAHTQCKIKHYIYIYIYIYIHVGDILIDDPRVREISAPTIHKCVYTMLIVCIYILNNYDVSKHIYIYIYSVNVHMLIMVWQ
jgi:hypothetical protein